MRRRAGSRRPSPLAGAGRSAAPTWPAPSPRRSSWRARTARRSRSWPARTPSGKRSKGSRERPGVVGRGARRVAAGAALLGAGGLIYAREVETRRVEVRSVELTLPRLAPEFDGYRIVQFGDFHLDDWSRPERLHRIVEKVNEQSPDLIAITGDFASYSAKEFDAEQLIEALRALGARDGSVAILGNHDYLTDVKLVRRCIREGGVEELINGVRTLRRDEAALHVAGVDDVMEGNSRLGLLLEQLLEGGAAV